MSTIETQGEVKLSINIADSVMTSRHRVSQLLIGSVVSLLDVQGPCAMTGHESEIYSEGDLLLSFSENTGITALHRLPPWKPRSNPQRDWEGEETTNPDGAMKILQARATKAANVCIELGLREHPERYSHLLSFGWIGGRNVGNADFQKQVALRDISLPLGIKNGLSGEIDEPLARIDHLSGLRGDEGAPIVLIYRGGENAQNPNDWEKQYKRAIELTEGKLIVDVAHGGEMAHDPEGRFKKSVEGQITCLDHVIELAKHGLRPLGVMIEASDVPSPTDPTIPFRVALNKVQSLNEVIRGQTAK